MSRLMPGVDVPWVTSWSAEETLGVGPCASVGGRLAVRQADRMGEGKPQYSMNHFRRQRESVAKMLCPMCGQPTAKEDRWTQVAKRIPAGVLRARGLGAALPPVITDERLILDSGSVAPLHDACVKRSLEHCPHLRGHAEIDVQPFPERWTVFPLTVQATAPAQPFAVMATPRQPKPMAVIGFLQILGVTEDSDPRWRRRLREVR
jgi:hypothetical protein